MKINKLLIASVLAVALLGCGKREPRHIVILPDVSGSIERESLEQAFKAIDALAGHLQRGDRLTIIPILGDAEAEASGRILRFEVPANRQAYDTDLRGFRSKLSASLTDMRANAVAHPGSKTDIVGSVELAAQELAPSGASQQELIILSDFIQESNEIDFRKDRRLASQQSARAFAAKRASADQFYFKTTKVRLGLIRSIEYQALEPQKRKAIQCFWTDYFKILGAQPKFFIDGVGRLASLN